MKQRVINDLELPAVGDVMLSEPIDIAETTRKMGILLDYTKGAEDGMSVTLEWQDIAEVNWYIMGDLTGAPAPSTNPWLSFTYLFTATATVMLPVPEHCLFVGMYRLRVATTGLVAPVGSVLTAYFVDGKVQ